MGAEATRGIGRVIHELVRAMLQIAPENKYVLIVRSEEHDFKSYPSVETIVADIPWYGLEEQIKMPRILSSAKADVVFIPHWNVPLFFRGPLVITIHDLLLRHYPHSAKTSTRNPITRLIKRLGYRLILWRAINNAKAILVPTEFVSRDVASFYPRAASKIVVTGEGMPRLEAGSLNLESRKIQIQGASPSFQLSASSFLLYVGAAYPHKGLQDLLQAWPTISEKHADLHLKIAGEMDAFMAAQKKWTEEHTLKNVEFLGRVSDEALDTLYTQAKALIFPSHFEGFGLPPLEAIARGCPVIASKTEASLEVLGQDSAIFFDPGSHNGIISAVEQVLGRPEKCGQLTAKAAQELARRHDWLKAAERTLQVLKKIGA